MSAGCLSPLRGTTKAELQPDSSCSYPKGTTAVLDSVVLSALAYASADSAVLLALAFAGAATAIVALGMLFMHLRRTSRLTPLIGGLGAASVAVMLAPLALVAGLASQPETAPETALLEVTPYALESYQLETLPVP